jgi:PhnB protein
MLVQPYLNFEGRAEEAIEFYKQALGAKVTMLMRFGEAADKPPPGTMPAGTDQKVMHSAMTIGDSVVMATDGYCSGQSKFEGVSLSLSAGSDSEAKRMFDALAAGGEVSMPLSRTFFASSFGMVKDRFGVSWMVVAAPMGS